MSIAVARDDLEELRKQRDEAHDMVEFLKGELRQLAKFNPDWDVLKATRSAYRELVEHQKKTQAERDEAREGKLNNYQQAVALLAENQKLRDMLKRCHCKLESAQTVSDDKPAFLRELAQLLREQPID